jgi:beta-xylosidase
MLMGNLSMNRRLLTGAVLAAALLLTAGLAAAQDATPEATPDAVGPFQNPIITSNFPDPFILQVDDTYYAYATNGFGRNVQTMTSTDLVTWTPGRDALPALPRWVNISGPDVWAPEVLRVADDDYRLYFTARNKHNGYQCIGVAVSDSPEGPFRDRGEEPFICQPAEGGSIDASPFRDADGTLYLHWKNDGNCCMRRTYLYAQEMTADGLGLVGEPVRLAYNDQPWEGTVVEAPSMWLRNGEYTLFYSGNMYAGEQYAIGYAACESALGPCTDAEENPILASDMTEQPLVVGPGHQTIITDEDGNTWIVYHVWQVSTSGLRTDTRQVWMDRLEWTAEGAPVVEGPTREPQ